jgi:hypothetical protein
MSRFTPDLDSPMLVTTMVGLSTTGHLFSQIPQPIQSSKSTMGCFTVFAIPPLFFTPPSMNQIAFLGVGGMFLTDDAADPLGIRETAILVDEGQADLQSDLFPHCELFYGP